MSCNCCCGASGSCGCGRTSLCSCADTGVEAVFTWCTQDTTDCCCCCRIS